MYVYISSRYPVRHPYCSQFNWETSVNHMAMSELLKELGFGLDISKGGI